MLNYRPPSRKSYFVFIFWFSLVGPIGIWLHAHFSLEVSVYILGLCLMIKWLFIKKPLGFGCSSVVEHLSRKGSVSSNTHKHIHTLYNFTLSTSLLFIKKKKPTALAMETISCQYANVSSESMWKITFIYGENLSKKLVILCSFSKCTLIGG